MSHAAEAPKPPDDPELRNVIDKLAQFVARNGQDFENMTKQKQKDNPRFAFLFGGEYFHYYIYKVNAEQAIMRKQKMQAEQNSLAQRQTLQQQIYESENNLKLQYDVLMQQQPTQIDDAIRIAEQEHLRDVANELKINFDDFSIALEQMHESCTKEAISLNKNWFFNHYSSQRHAEVILNFLVNKTKDPSVPFLFKLHLLYLVNDLTHHYMRKQNDQMLNLLGRFVVTMFTCAYTTHSSDEQQKEKLEKLRSIWEAQRYFSDDTLKKLSNVQDTYSDYQANLRQEYSSTVAEVQAKIQSQYKQFESQHIDYKNHIEQQIASLETRKINPPVTPFTPNLQLQSLSRGLLGTSPNIPPVLSGDSGSPSQPPARRSRFDAAPMSAAGPLPVNIPPPAIAQPSLSSAVRSNFPPMNQNAPPPISNMGHGGLPPPMVPPWQQGPPPGSCHPPPFSTRGPPPQLQTMAPPPAMYDFPPFPPNRNTAPPGMPPMNMQQPPRPLFPPASGLPGPPPRLGGPPPMGPGPGAPSVPPWNTQMGPTPPPPGPGGMPSSWPPPNQAPLRPLAPLNNNSPIRQQPPPPLEDVSLIPKAAYYDLPAGLMVPLVKLEDHGYKSLDPSKIRLPPPMPPSERLLAAVEAFYAPPNHENPRDSEGWERLGLYEYFKAKQSAVQGSKIDDASRDYGRTDSRRSPPSSQRRSRSYSRSDSRSRSRSRTTSPRSRSRNSRSDSRSRHNTRSSRSRSRSKSRSRSRTRSMSRSPDRRRHRRSRSLSHSRSPPPKFSSDRRRGESSSNVNESGSSGSFYQGLGASSGNDDPFENFRKAQSGMFIQRIRAADPRTKHPPAPEQLN